MVLGSVSSLVSSASAVGFCGSRSALPPSVVSASVFGAVASSAVVSVGCARGFDFLARGAFPSASVWSASSFGVGRGAFARRSVAFVRSLSRSASPLLVAFPACSAPVGLAPSAFSSRCFCGLGSGSWASVALAVGLGCPVLVWLPSGVSAPASWGFVSVGGGFWFCGVAQGVLF